MLVRGVEVAADLGARQRPKRAQQQVLLAPKPDLYAAAGERASFELCG
jgi:hypothetical protein